MLLTSLLIAQALMVGPAVGSRGFTAPDVHRVGNRLIDRLTGRPVTLKGIAMMSGEYACVHSTRVFDGPANRTVVDGMAAWGINAIRLPMNEDCWLGLHGATVSGPAYQRGFVAFVEELLGAGFVVVLDLHWTSHTAALATGQDLFLSADSVTFWASVAAHPALRNRPGVVFELFNEPHDGTLSHTPPRERSAPASLPAASGSVGDVTVGAGEGRGGTLRRDSLSANLATGVAESPIPDPNCSTGILNRRACCPESCGVCGGPKCGGNPCSGELPCYQQCCEGSDAIKNRSCDLIGPPCHLGPGPHPPPPPGPPSKKATITAECFLDGKDCPAAGFAGYNQAVNAVRATANATNLVLFAGKGWNFDLEWLLANFPTDPLGNCGAAWHPYEFKCRYFDCNANVSGPLTAEYPIFVTEWAPGFPQSNHSASTPDLYSQRVLAWADAMPGTVQLFPWVWNPGNGSEHVLAAGSSFAGDEPTPWGLQYKGWRPKA